MAHDLLRGHLDAMLLSVLELGPAHGYGIAAEIGRRSDSAVEVPAGSLYPALHRLERAQWVSSDWALVGGRRRRTYSLTPEGQQVLDAQRAEWRRHVRSVSAVLGT